MVNVKTAICADCGRSRSSYPDAWDFRYFRALRRSSVSRIRDRSSLGVNGFRRIVSDAGSPAVSSISSLYPDMMMTGRSGRVARSIFASASPLAPGMLASVNNKSIVPASLASASASLADAVGSTR